ncbi:MAG: isochorismatase-family hydrolase [Pseudonocardiales bacterium]|jgi:nicotinamidase-related amidase|nr:isochorismatase-family hydrolase [Pseudonocardiales bacterium]
MTVPTPINPAECALLVMDFQPAALSGLENSEVLIKNANSAIEHARAGGVQVLFVRIGFEDRDYVEVPPTNKAFTLVAENRWLHNDADATALDRALDVAPTDIVIRKTRVGALHRTTLDEELTNRGITTLILAGVHTGGVVLSTVRDAADRDYRLFLLDDAIADPSEDVHRVLMQHVFPRQASIVTVAQLADLLVASVAV